MEINYVKLIVTNVMLVRPFVAAVLWVQQNQIEFAVILPSSERHVPPWWCDIQANLLGPTHVLPSHRAKADQVTTTGVAT
jgi:hypothetical protein